MPLYYGSVAEALAGLEAAAADDIWYSKVERGEAADEDDGTA